ncbi:hypothetical protein C8R45DRAFT_932406 [Mycena sanguinolenta]|nr:hypothetical protein C8R45DRAFT_932406 [Mycena sanguinolenta]
MDHWLRSLRADAAPTRTLRDNASKSTSARPFALPSLEAASSTNPRNTTRLRVASTARQPMGDTTTIINTRRLAPPSSQTVSAKPKTASTKPLASMLAQKTPVTSFTKCPNLCCDENLLAKPLEFPELEPPYTYVDGPWVECIREIIASTEHLHTPLLEVLARLKCLRAGQLASAAPVHPPPNASPEGVRLRHIILQLELRSREISRYLGAKPCLLAPIRRLPPELVQQVFLFAVRSKICTTLTLAHVCGYWRAVALGMSQFWATIELPISAAKLDFYISHSTSAPLAIICSEETHRYPFCRALKKIARISHRWHTLSICYLFCFKELNVIRQRIPLLKYLRIRYYPDEIATIFRDAPSLRRVTLAFGYYSCFSPSSLSWDQLTFLTLDYLNTPLFSQYLSLCPHLLYFTVSIDGHHRESLPGVGGIKTHTSLRKLVLRSTGSQDVFVEHTFPHLLSLTIQNFDRRNPHFFAFLARSNHLEMLSILEPDADRHRSYHLLPVELLFVTPSLRIILFRGLGERRAMVTSRFYMPLVVRFPNNPFSPVVSLTRYDNERVQDHEDIVRRDTLSIFESKKTTLLAEFAAQVAKLAALFTEHAALLSRPGHEGISDDSGRELSLLRSKWLTDVSTQLRKNTKFNDKDALLAFDMDALLAVVDNRMERDPYGIENARLIDPEGEGELDYLNYL